MPTIEHPDQTISINHEDTTVVIKHDNETIKLSHPDKNISVSHPSNTTNVKHQEKKVGVVHKETTVNLHDGGKRGLPGTPGAPGAAATVEIGSTTTGEPETDAEVTNVGTTSAAILDFTIPQGAKGAKGDQGDPGADGDKNYTMNFTNTDFITVEHNLNKYPSVTVINSANDEVVGDVEYLNVNSLTVTFIGSFSGKVTCN